MSAEELERTLAAGGVVLFPADTVYGLACEPELRRAVDRLYEIKGRPPERPAAVMFFSVASALEALPELGPRTREVAEELLPGGVTLLLPNPERRFPLACGPTPEVLGLRVPEVEEPVRSLRRPVMQSSANPSGGADARRLSDVSPAIREAVDLEIDGGELPGTPSTVIDLTSFEDARTFEVLREGAVPAAVVRSVVR